MDWPVSELWLSHVESVFNGSQAVLSDGKLAQAASSYACLMKDHSHDRGCGVLYPWVFDVRFTSFQLSSYLSPFTPRSPCT